MCRRHFGWTTMFPIKVLSVLGLVLAFTCNVDLKTLKRDKVSGFMDVAGNLQEGNPLYYDADMSKCSSRAPLGHYGYNNRKENDFNEKFGGYVDVFDLISDKDVADIPFFKFSNMRHERNSTDNLVTVHREMVYWDNETVEVTISVMTPDLQIVMNVYQYSCSLGNNNDGILFYASKSEIQPLSSYKSLVDSLTAGKRVRFTADFRICLGAELIHSAGGEMKDYDLVSPGQNITSIRTTLESTVQNKNGHFDQHILYGEIFDSGMIFFTDSFWQFGSAAPESETKPQCYMQQDRPGGAVNFYLVPS